MTNGICEDCGVELDAHETIALALADSRLDDEERRRFVAAALADVEDPAAPRPVARYALAAMLAVTVLVGVWWRSSRDEVVAWTSIEDERKANQAYLERADVQRKLTALTRGTFVAVAGGGTFDSDTNLVALLQRVERKHPHARHRFVFRAGEQGDVVYKARFGKAPFLSGELINRMRLGVTGAPGGKHTFFRLAPGQELGAKMTIPKDRMMVTETLALPLEVGPPGTGIAVAVRAAYRPSYEAPLVLRDGLATPRFEIPGRATLVTSTGRRPCRRYLVEVSVPELGIRFEPIEAIGNALPLEGEKGVVTIAGRELAFFTGPAFRRAQEHGRPILVAELPTWYQRSLRDRVSIVAPELDRFDLFWRRVAVPPSTRKGGPKPVALRLLVFDAKGEQRRALDVTGATPFAKVRSFLRGR